MESCSLSSAFAVVAIPKAPTSPISNRGWEAWICLRSAWKSFSPQKPPAGCGAPRDGPALAQPCPWEQEGQGQIQTVPELEGGLILGCFSDLHIQTQGRVCRNACDDSSPACRANTPEYIPAAVQSPRAGPTSEHRPVRRDGAGGDTHAAPRRTALADARASAQSQGDALAVFAGLGRRRAAGLGLISPARRSGSVRGRERRRTRRCLSGFQGSL